MDAESLERAIPPGAVAAEPAEQDDLAPDGAERGYPVVQTPHAHAARAVGDLLVHEAREFRGRGDGKVLLLDRHHERLALRERRGEEVVHGLEDLLEGGFLGRDAVVGDQLVVLDRESDVDDADSGVELGSEWRRERLALGDGPAVE